MRCPTQIGEATEVKLGSDTFGSRPLSIVGEAASNRRRLPSLFPLPPLLLGACWVPVRSPSGTVFLQEVLREHSTGISQPATFSGGYLVGRR